MLGVKNKNIYSTSGEAIRFIDSQLHRVELNRMDMQMMPKVLNGLQFHIAFAYAVNNAKRVWSVFFNLKKTPIISTDDTNSSGF